MWLVLLASHDLHFDLDRQMIGMPVRSPRAIGQSFQADVVIAPEDRVAGLARDVEVPAHRGHLLPLQEPGNELQPFINLVTLLPGHFALPAKGPIV
jgi:hypothetical protein